MTQETFLRLVDKVETGVFDPAQGRIEAFAFGIANYIRLERSRKRQDGLGETADSLVDPDPSSESQMLVYEQAKALRACIAALPPKEREIMTLLIDRDLSMNEIAAICQVPTGTIKSHVHRAKAKIKTLWTKRFSEYPHEER